jgi:hypothetical protein
MTPLIKQRVVVTGLGHALQEIGGNDLVGINVGSPQGNADALDHRNFVH